MKKVLQGLELLLILLFLLLGGSVVVSAAGIVSHIGKFVDWRLISLMITAGTLLIINAALMLVNFWRNNLSHIIQVVDSLIFVVAVIGLILFGSYFAIQWFAAIGLVLYSVLLINFR